MAAISVGRFVTGCIDMVSGRHPIGSRTRAAGHTGKSNWNGMTAKQIEERGLTKKQIEEREVLMRRVLSIAVKCSVTHYAVLLSLTKGAVPGGHTKGILLGETHRHTHAHTHKCTHAT